MLARSLQNNKAVGLGAAALVGGVLVYLLWTYTTSSSTPPPPPTKPLKTSSVPEAADTAEKKSEQEKFASEDQERQSIDRRRTSLEHTTPAQEPKDSEQPNEPEHSEQTEQTEQPEEHEQSENPEHPEPQVTPAVSVSAKDEANHEGKLQTGESAFSTSSVPLTMQIPNPITHRPITLFKIDPEPVIPKTEELTPQEPEQPKRPTEIEHSVQVDHLEEDEQPEQPESESIPATSGTNEADTAVLEPTTIEIENGVSQEPEQPEKPEQPEQPEQLEQPEQPELDLIATTSSVSDNEVDIEVPEPAIIKSADSAPNSGHKWADLINEVEQIALTKTQEPSPPPTKVTEQETMDVDGTSTGLPAATAPAFDPHVVKAEIPNPVAASLSSSQGTSDAATTTNRGSLEPSIHNRDATRRELNTNAAVFTPSWLLKPSPAASHTSGTIAPKQGSPAAPHDSANGKSKPPRCRFWPKCTNKSCKFTHPTLPCRDPDNCTFGDRCLFVHPKDLNKRKEIRRPARGNSAAAAQ
ncbi:hypothetical protein EC968_000823 [Mortierella alpina]|nr:hypothetical protein EC968_000823 [Mortierella alpina]